MKDYVVDLEIAKELIDNGFSQSCYLFWKEYCPNPSKHGSYFYSRLEIGKGHETTSLYISAPCSDEILKELPKRISNHQYLCIVKDDQTYWCGYDGKTLKDEIAVSAKKLSNTLAKLFIRLKKEGYLK